MKKTRAALVALMAAVLAATAHAQQRADPLQGGTPVTYKSSQGDAIVVSIDAVLYKPDTSAKGAVVIVNGGSSPTDSREGQYARALSSAGYAVLAIDSYRPRGIVRTGSDNASISTYVQAHDALAARRYLVSAGYAADRMAVMGTGRGGTIALLVADRTFVQDEKGRFAAAMAITPGCLFHPKTPKPASRLFIAIGEKDDVAGVQPCKELAKEFAAAGGRVDVKVYPGSSNGFDGSPNDLRMTRDSFIETFVNCIVPVEPDGRSAYNGKTFAEGDTAGLLTELRTSCVKHGGSNWTNLTQKATVTFDLIDFLDANFRR